MSNAGRSIETRPPAQVIHRVDDKIHQSFSPRQIQKGRKSSVVQWRRVRIVSDSEEYKVIHTPEIKDRWFDWIVEIFQKPSAEKLAFREYEEARRNLLEYQRMRDYYENMCRYQTKRIVRLQETLKLDSD